MTTWVRITARSMWHREISREGLALIVTDCGQTMAATEPERQDGGRPASGRVCVLNG